MLGAPLAELPGANAKLRRSLRQPLAAVQQPLHRLRLELPREAPSGSPLRHPSLLGCRGSLANPPAPGGKSKLIETVEALRVRGIGFRSLTEALDTTTAPGRLVFHMFGALAEFERSLIRERTQAGLAAARRAGRTGGHSCLQRSSRQRLVGLSRSPLCGGG